MKRFTCIFLVFFLITVAGCNKDENDNITLPQLYQSIWEGNITEFSSEDDQHGITAYTFILEFISESSGKCVLQDDGVIKDFRYTVTDSMISFEGRVVSGDWYITECSKDKIILLRYRPKKTIMTLDRIY